MGQRPEPPERQPRCGISADVSGRLRFKLEDAPFGVQCPAGMAAEAAVCAVALVGQENTRFIGGFLPLLFIDLALAKVAAAGVECFDSSRWGKRVFGFSGEDYLWWHGTTLRKALGNVGVPPPPEDVFNTSVCPPDAHTPATVLAAQRRESIAPVSCLVPLVWPAQRSFMDAILDTYGPDCDDLQFFIAAEGEPARQKAPGGSAEIINLHAIYPDVVHPDRTEFDRTLAAAPATVASNTIKKLLLMLRWAAEDDWGVPHWHCRLERDTYFVPENFRLLVASLGLHPFEPHYLGARQFFDVGRSGMVFNDGGPGICFSTAALLRLHEALKEAPTLQPGQAPNFEDCAFGTGHREDMMLAICMRRVGVHPSPLTTDARGREWFSIRPLRAIPALQPPPWEDSEGSDAFSWNYWTGRAHLFMPCWGRNRFWIVDTPVSFNSFKNASMFYDAHDLLTAQPAQRHWALGGYPASLSGFGRTYFRPP